MLLVGLKQTISAASRSRSTVYVPLMRRLPGINTSPSSMKNHATQALASTGYFPLLRPLHSSSTLLQSKHTVPSDSSSSTSSTHTRPELKVTDPSDAVENNTILNYLLRFLGIVTRANHPSVRRKFSAKRLYDSMLEQTERKEFYSNYSLDTTFISWFKITLLHVWMVFVRLRAAENGRDFSQNLFEVFWQDCEAKLLEVGVTNPVTLGKEMKKFTTIYFGSLVAYDIGLLEGDSSLADTLWRNVLNKNPAITAGTVHSLIEYIKRELHNLEQLDDETIIDRGVIKWGKPITINNQVGDNQKEAARA